MGTSENNAKDVICNIALPNRGNLYGLGSSDRIWENLFRYNLPDKNPIMIFRIVGGENEIKSPRNCNKLVPGS